MSVDPLDKYRSQRKPASPTEEAEDGPELPFPDEEKGYMAYRPANKVKRLIVQRKSEAHRAPAYTYLIDVMWDADQGREIGLVFSHATILLRGQHLQELARQLAGEKVQFIREFDPGKWPRPAPGEPVIESIEFKTAMPDVLNNTKKTS